jgi:hypothetical protein
LRASLVASRATVVGKSFFWLLFGKSFFRLRL